MLFQKNNTQLKNYELFDHRNKKIYLANMTKELNETFSELFEKRMRKYLRENKKIWILINTSTESLNLKNICSIYQRHSMLSQMGARGNLG